MIESFPDTLVVLITIAKEWQCLCTPLSAQPRCLTPIKLHKLCKLNKKKAVDLRFSEGWFTRQPLRQIQIESTHLSERNNNNNKRMAEK